MQKQKKAEEWKLAALELRKIQEQAVHFAEENAALERKLRKVFQSLSDAGSSMATSIKGPMVVEFGRIDSRLHTHVDLVVSPVALAKALFGISLHGCGSGFEGGQVYP